MSAKTLMIQGTASNVGKSVIVAGLCRIFRQEGFRVAPFKAQNMSLNSYVTLDGKEIARAQVVQAEAAGIEPTVETNPILLKPSADSGSQVIVLGKPIGNMTAKEYYKFKKEVLKVVKDSLEKLIDSYDVVIVEGAGSPAEVNLKKHDLVNMRVAHMAKSPVLLVGDIDRGGVFASIVGTLELLSKRDKERIKGFIINKFRGDVDLLKPGLRFLERRTGKRVFGVVPYFRGIRIDDEDSVSLEDKKHLGKSSKIRIAVIKLPRISNFTDFRPLEYEEGVVVDYVERKEDLDDADSIIIPGTKSTISDLLYIRQSGIEEKILQKAKEAPIIGICGGYQMLGKLIIDKEHVESNQERIVGMGLLDIVTTFEKEKTLKRTEARVLNGGEIFREIEGQIISGYEIHMGRPWINSNVKPFLEVLGNSRAFDGAVANGMPIYGTYLHGIFENANLKATFIQKIAERKGLKINLEGTVLREDNYNILASFLRESLNMKEIYKLLK
jgi:adenosylcobyric acid synthase